MLVRIALNTIGYFEPRIRIRKNVNKLSHEAAADKQPHI